MEYQKIRNLLDKQSDVPAKFRTKNWVEVNDDARGTYNTNSQIKFKTTMLMSKLCDYSDAYILVKGTVTIVGAGADAAAQAADRNNKQIMFKNCAPFTNCISEINNTQIDNAKDLDVVMPMYNLIEYSENYSKTSGSLYQYARDVPANPITDSTTFTEKSSVLGNTAADGTKQVEIVVPLKYLSNFWRTLEMPLINCDVNLMLTWSSSCIIANATGNSTFAITDTKLYVPVVTLSSEDNTKLLSQLKSGFKRTIYWNEYLSKITTEAQNQYLDYLIDPSFQGANRLFVLAFEDAAHRTRHTGFFLPTVEIKDYNVMIDGRNLFDQPVKTRSRTYDDLRKLMTGKGDDYTTGSLLDYSYFREHYKIIAVDLSKQQVFDSDPRAIQQINFTGNLDRAGNTTIFFVLEKAKETVLDFSQGTVRVM